MLETLQYLKLLSSHGMSFKSFTEQYLDGTGIFKDAIIGILAALAHQERVRLSERVTAGLERARKEGRVGRPAKEKLQAGQRVHSAFGSCVRKDNPSARLLTSWATLKPTLCASARYWDAHRQHRRQA